MAYKENNLKSNVFESLSDAYKKLLEDLIQYGNEVPAVDNPLSPARHYGRKPSSPTIELLNYSFTVTNPYNSLFHSEDRIISLPYAIGLFIWSLAGSDNAEWLSYYHPNVNVIFEDASHLSGAFGRRMFNYLGIINQVDKMVEKLKKLPTTRRATITITVPEDHLVDNKEFPCALGTQYFIRDKKLHSITYMRAQSAMVVMPYDAFLFMNLQIAIAAKLNIEVGSYTHNAGTIHIYKDELKKTERILTNEFHNVNLSKVPSDLNKFSEFQKLITFENKIRNNKMPNIHFFEDVNYFSDIKNILISYYYYKWEAKVFSKEKFLPFFSNLPVNQNYK